MTKHHANKIMLTRFWKQTTPFNKRQPTIQAVQGKTGLTHLEELYWKPNEIYHLHIEEHRIRCYLIAMWRKGASDKNVPKHTFANTRGWQRKVNWNMKVRIFKSNYMIILYYEGKVLGIPQNIQNCTSFATHTIYAQTAKYSSPVAGDVCADCHLENADGRLPVFYLCSQETSGRICII